MSPGHDLATTWIAEHAQHQGDACLPWPYQRLGRYGTFVERCTTTYAHTRMCEIVHGARPSAAHQAAFSCEPADIACCNPRHLAWRTRSEMRVLGQARRRARGHKPRLNHIDVARIRELAASKTPTELARIFPVTRQTITRIIRLDTRPTGFHSANQQRLFGAIARRSLSLPEIATAAHYATKGATLAVLRKMEQRGEIVRIGERYRAPIQRREAQTAYTVVRDAIPPTLPREARDDIAAAVMLQFAEGTLDLADLDAAIKRATTGYWREYSRYTTVSLDAPRGPYGFTILDRLPDPNAWSPEE